VVWRTAEVPAADHMEQMSDMYVVVKMGSEKMQTTDIHWRCATGAGSFNWRCVFPVTIRHKESAKERLTVQIFDKDILNSDDAIGEVVIPLQSYFRQAFSTKAKAQGPIKRTFTFEGDQDVKPSSVNAVTDKLRSGWASLSSGGTINPKAVEKGKFWVKVKGAKGAEAGYVELSLELLPKEVADTKAAGFGRSEPNDNPKLPDPTGRLSLSLNPFTNIASLVGPQIARKICCYCCCFFCVFFTIWLCFNTFPVLLGTGVAEIFKQG